MSQDPNDYLYKSFRPSVPTTWSKVCINGIVKVGYDYQLSVVVISLNPGQSWCEKWDFNHFLKAVREGFYIRIE